MRSKRLAAGLLALLAPLVLFAVACSGGAAAPDEPSPSTTPTGTPTVTATPSASASPSPTPTPTVTASSTLEPTPDVAADPNAIRGFAYPIEGACLPAGDHLMPNAPRPYRNGTHEGVDFYPGLACASIGLGTPVFAMQAGTVSRADGAYRDITTEQVAALDRRTQEQGFSDPATLDVYRGRQIWIDHGGGLVSRYAHLSSIAPGIVVGAAVEQGQLIGTVGESGTPESVTDPGTEVHLHAEVRVGDSFLGAGLPPGDVRRLYEVLFSPSLGAR